MRHSITRPGDEPFIPWYHYCAWCDWHLDVGEDNPWGAARMNGHIQDNHNKTWGDLLMADERARRSHVAR